MEFYSNDVFPEGIDGSTAVAAGVLRGLKSRGEVVSERIRGRKGLKWRLLNNG